MIGEDVAISETGEVTGTVKYIASYPEFSSNPEEQKGNYFPFTLSKTGSQMTIKKNGAPTKENIDYDKDIIFRLTEKTDTISVDVDGEEAVSLSFNGATLQTADETGSGRVNIMGQGETAVYGSKKVSELMQDDVHINWEGTTGYVTGTFNNVNEWAELPGGTKSGHFFAMTIDEKYKDKPFDFIMDDQEPGTHADKAGDDEMKWVLRIDVTKKFTFKSDSNVIAILDFSKATLN